MAIDAAGRSDQPIRPAAPDRRAAQMWAGTSRGSAKNPPPTDAISTNVAASNSTLRTTCVTVTSTAAGPALFRDRPPLQAGGAPRWGTIVDREVGMADL